MAVDVVSSGAVPDRHRFLLSFTAPSPDSVRATAYTLADSTSGLVLFRTGSDLEGAGTGPVGEGLLPVISTLPKVEVDTTRSGLSPGSPTNLKLTANYEYGATLMPDNLRRDDYPDDITITFYNAIVDTSTNLSVNLPPKPARFKVVSHTPQGDHQLDFGFRDSDGSGTLSRADEFIDILTGPGSQPAYTRATWRISVDTLGLHGAPLRPLAAGDVYELRLQKPFTVADTLSFAVSGERVDPARAQATRLAPYVVPNPYIAAASFEPQRFAVSGRGERRIEFRGLPAHCTLRIYTVRGDLVQTLQHDGGNDGMIPWNLRTKDNLDLAPGLYVFQVDAGGLGTSIGKFAIIK